ncbi:MAG TPA: ChbG/HpnK family deacetylase [Candidatus Sulfotelmatobacter sp.]|nr:ChbG/HpnK family deacetylase [Candidatus Sulfotelmatobacter sp.]
MLAGRLHNQPVENGPAAKRLIVNADDLGLSHGITDGILSSHRDGIVTSASLMVNQPATAYAVACLHDAPNLDVGIHLNLCQGKPVLPARSIPSLVAKNGEFLPPAEISRRLVRWQASPKEIEAEFCAQIDRMLAYGLTPSHADSHHRLHIYPAAATVFRSAIRSRGIFRARGATKQTWPQSNLGAAHAGSFYRRVAVDTYNHALQRWLFRGLKMPDAGVSLHPRFRGKPQQCGEAWQFAIQNMPAGTYEIWCHPGFRQKSFSEGDRLSEQRELEAAMLTDRRLFETIQSSGVQLINFRDL